MIHRISVEGHLGRGLAGIATALATALAAEVAPLELRHIPVNGTDATTDPTALTIGYGFTSRTGSKIAEHGDELALLDDWNGIETPHRKWASPYANGPVRVLVITGMAGTRDALELRQRADFAMTILPLPGILGDAPPASQPVVHEFFRKRFAAILAREYDVILLLHANTEHDYPDFPDVMDTLLEALVAKVEAGYGLVLMQTSGRWYRMPEARREQLHRISPIKHGNQGTSAIPVRTGTASPVTGAFAFGLWPAIKANFTTLNPGGASLLTLDGHPVLATGTLGKGRVAAFAYHAGNSSLPDFDDEKTPRFDDWHELVYAAQLKALAWAAGKEPVTRLHVPETVACPAGEAPRIPLSIEAPATGCTLQWSLQDPFGNPLADGDMPVAGGESVPALPVCRINGLHRLNLWVRRNGKVDNWGYAAIQVSGGASVRLEPAAASVRPGAAAGFRVVSSVPGRLRVELRDDLNRISFVQDFEVTDSREIAVDTGRVLVPGNRITATLHDAAGTVLARTVQELRVPWIGLQSMGEDFLVLTYGEPRLDRHLSAFGGLLYRQAGFNGVYLNWHTRNYIRHAFNKGVYSVTGAMSPYMKQADLEPELKNSPNKAATIAEWTKNVTQAVADLQTYGGVGRTLDDEAFLAFTQYKDGEMRGAQTDQAPETLALMREHLQKKYGDIANLNTAWDTKFASWAEVRLIAENEVDVLGNPSGWVEGRQYMNWTYANKYYGFIQSLHAPLGADYGVGPGAPHFTTREGGPTYRAGDFSELRKTLRFIMAYGGPEAGLFENAYVGQPGGQKYDPPLEWQQHGSWYHLLNGADALWYYYGSALIGPELAWRRRTEWATQGIREIVDGAGVLVSRAKPMNRQVCILYSAENYAMGWLFAKRKDAWRGLALDSRTRSENTFVELLDKLLFAQPRYVTTDDLTSGGLADCKLLILPQTLNLSDAAAAAIRTFVQGGGAVVADLLPATREQFGKPRAESALADVFGVKGTGTGLHREAETWYSIGVRYAPDQTRWPGESTWLPGDTWTLGLEPTTASAQGRALSKEGREAPVCLMNEFGSGKALLLNFVYTKLDAETSGWHRAFGDGLAAWAGIQPPARIVDPRTGAPLAYRPLRAFQRGAATLLGSIRGNMVWSGGRPILVDLSRALDVDDTARFAWTGPRHVYNVRAGRYLGYGETADIDLPSYHGRLLALLPYQVETITLTAPATAKPGEIVTCRAQVVAKGAAAGEHVLRFKVVAPGGYENPFYARTHTAATGTATFTLPLANNDRNGEWTLVVRDVMTGVESRQGIQVK